jgi:VRR-NUC domain.
MRVASGPRQLSLFKGRRQRGIAPPPPLEFSVQCALADTLKRWCLPGWWYSHLPFGEYRLPATARKLQRMGVRPGLPDFIFLHQLGDTAWLELKRGRSKLSDDQQTMFGYLAKRGDTVMLATSYQEAVAALQDASILPRTIKPQ